VFGPEGWGGGYYSRCCDKQAVYLMDRICIKCNDQFHAAEMRSSRNLKVYYHTHKALPLDPVLFHINPLLPYFFNIHRNAHMKMYHTSNATWYELLKKKK
jgi:hypothetical protein